MSVTNTPIIIQVLNILGVDVGDFNEKSELIIDLCPYYAEILENKVQKNRLVIKNKMYATCKKEEIELQKKFLHNYNEYIALPFNLQNSVKFDAAATFMSRFGQFINIEEGVDATEIWMQYYEDFRNGKEPAIVQDIIASEENDSLLYFGYIDELNKRYEFRVTELNRTEEKETEVLEHPVKTLTPMLSVNVSAADAKTTKTES